MNLTPENIKVLRELGKTLKKRSLKHYQVINSYSEARHTDAEYMELALSIVKTVKSASESLKGSKHGTHNLKEWLTIILGTEGAEVFYGKDTVGTSENAFNFDNQIPLFLGHSLSESHT